MCSRAYSSDSTFIQPHNTHRYSLVRAYASALAEKLLAKVFAKCRER